AGRVTRADDVDVEPVGRRRLALGGAVRDASAQQSTASVQLEPPPGNPAGDDDRAAVQHVAGVEMHLPLLRVDPADLPGDEDLCAEALRLLECAAGELLAADARGKAQVVLDP